MTDNDGQSLLTSQTNDPTAHEEHLGHYIPLASVDKSIYELVHPENAMTKLGMSSRTAYRKMDSGELPYTIDAGAKRALVKKRQTSPTKPVSNETVNNRHLSDTVSDFDKFLAKMPDMKTVLSDREAEIKSLQNTIHQMHEAHKSELDSLRRTSEAQIQTLRESLESERIRNAKAEAELASIVNIHALVASQKETITTQKTTIDALNNERIVISGQLQKYRENVSHNNPDVRQSDLGDSQKGWIDRLFGR